MRNFVILVFWLQIIGLLGNLCSFFDPRNSSKTGPMVSLVGRVVLSLWAAILLGWV